MKRRAFLSLVAACYGCSRAPAGLNGTATGRLKARPATPTGAVRPGRFDFAPSTGLAGSLYVPSSYTAQVAHPLLVMLHGAGGTQTTINNLMPLVEEQGVIMLAPRSLGPTWDLMINGVGPDVALIDDALAYTFTRAHIDPARIALGGFSDGASYALTIGLANGDLFNKLIAFSPGFFEELRLLGKPPVRMTHGTADTILPIERTGRPVARRLRDLGYAVDFREFEGGHQVRREDAAAALAWLVGR